MNSRWDVDSSARCQLFTCDLKPWRHVVAVAIMGAFLVARLLAADESPAPIKGLPFSRFYPYEEIGEVSCGVRLSFDGLNRIVAIHKGALRVLNDDVWLDLAVNEPAADAVEQAVWDADGAAYFGGAGNWGMLRPTDDGRLRPESFTPPDCPGWATATTFTNILCRPEGIYFGGFGGVVYWDRRTARNAFIEVPRLIRIFSIGEKVYVSSYPKGVHGLDREKGALVDEDRRVFGSTMVDEIVGPAGGRSLVSTLTQQLFWHEGGELRPLIKPPDGRLDGAIAAVQSLIGGNFAVAVTGKGLFIISPEGEIETAFTDPNYRRVDAIATNEAGVLWVATEGGVSKILYDAPVTGFGHALGIPVSWPQLTPWEGGIVVSSGGRLYESAPGARGEPVPFREVDSPALGAWAVASFGEWLLVGNQAGVFAKKPGQAFVPILANIDTARLVMLRSGICFVIGATEIAVLKYEREGWEECAPRVPGVGFPAVVHAAKDSAWIEMGVNRAARVALRSGKLQTRIFDSFPWSGFRWINVSVVGDVAVLSGPPAGRLFFDENSEELREDPALEEILTHAPYWPDRIQADDDGRLWVSHRKGVFTLSLRGGRVEADTATYRLVNERDLQIRNLPGSGIWISNGDFLYHVVRDRKASPPPFRPMLVSARDARTNRELPTDPRSGGFPRRLRYDENSLTLRFFAGSYAARRMPGYEFSVNGNAWTSLDPNSVLKLADLAEGNYNLTVRLVDDYGPLGAGNSFRFSVATPWFRTWYACVAYGVVAAALLVGLVQLSLCRARAKHALLEAVVAERTEALEATMQKLQQETRTAATLAERNRLAGEIHDSLEQGFSGLLFQLETTAAFASCSPEVRDGLAVARNMVAFSRNEVRHAVWDLHSPMLASGGLEAALRHIIAQTTPEPTQASVTVAGAVRSLGSTIEHHLLRIAQEAIANAVKHASAAHLDVRLGFGDAEMALEVRDDGCGFDASTMLNGAAGHFGLRSLRGRAGKIGATLQISSKPGAGTRITVRLPLSSPVSV